MFNPFDLYHALHEYDSLSAIRNPVSNTMSNRRVKSLAVDDDDFDEDYDENYDEPQGEELTDEDKQQMQQGTIKVREGLGAAYKVSDKDIQEALWHYYYDIGKSVSYLKSRYSLLLSR